MGVKLSLWIDRIRKKICKYAVYIEEIRRVRAPAVLSGEGFVEAKCIHCGERLTADFGLVLEAELLQRPK